MTRKMFMRNTTHKRSPYSTVSAMLTDINTTRYGSYMKHTVTDMKAHRQALNLIREWNRIDLVRIDNYLDKINALHIVTRVITDNVKHASERKYVIGFINQSYIHINKIIESYNEYIKFNPLLTLVYKPLHTIDFKGVLLV